MQNTVYEKNQNTDIMIIDDSSDDLYLLIGILGGNGFKVNWENSVETAFASIKIKKPDLIFLAVHMTGVNGYEVGRRLKNEQDTKKIPLIFLFDLEESRNGILEFKGSGVDFITKPYQTEDVLIRVNNHLEINYLCQELEQSNQNLLEWMNRQKETEMILQIERDRLKTILQTAGDGVICTDSIGLITMINESACNLTGWLMEEAIGKPIERVFRLINDSTREKSDNFVKKVLETGKTVSIRSQILLLSKDGNECAVEVSAAPVFQRKGKADGTIVMFRDYYSNVKKIQKKNEVLNNLEQLNGKYIRRNTDSEQKRSGEDKYLPFAFVIADVNGLGLTNNSFGTKYSELLLKKVADVLKNECRPDDIVVRIGEEKFLVLMPDCDAKYADILITRLNKSVARQNIRNIVFTLSVDFSLNSNIYSNIDALLKNAEVEMCKNNNSDSLGIKSKIIFVIMNTLFSKNNIEKSHSEMVSNNSVAIAKNMDFNEQELQQIKLAGLIHDIGKIGINEIILNTQGKLTAEDWKAVKRHPEIGFRILKSSYEFSEISSFVLEHHERWDGKGYPRGLSGEEISLQTRIIAVADTFDDIISERPYKKKLHIEDAINEIKKCAGKQFDPDVVRVFVENVLGKDCE
ncbi:MAG: HD domain-containing phosphohydrolase [Eubacteriales bacterium]